MASSGGVQKLLVEKGEKIGLGAAAVFGGLFLVIGVMEMISRPQDPDSFAKEVNDKAGQLNSQMAGGASELPAIDDALRKGARQEPVPTQLAAFPYYDRYQPPDGKRLAPVVLPPSEGQVDLVTAKIPASDIEITRDRDTLKVEKIRVGVLTATDPNQKIEGTSKFVESVVKGTGQRPGRKRGAPGSGGPEGGGGMGMMGGGPGGMMGMGMGGGKGGPGGMPGGGMMGMAKGGMPGGGMMGMGMGAKGGMPGGGMMGMGKGMPGMGMMGMGGVGGVEGSVGDTRQEVQYIEGVDEDAIDKKINNRPIAITIKPIRMAIIQASFPYREQIERFRQALRYESANELYAHADDMPVFHGLDVQRRTYDMLNQMEEDWTSIDLVTSTQDIRAVSLENEDETEDILRVSLHEDHMLAMPLPRPYGGSSTYPAIRLPKLAETIRKLKKSGARAATEKPKDSKYLGKNNPFSRGTGASANMFGMGGEGGAGAAGQMMGGGMANFFRTAGKKGGGGDGPDGKAPATVQEIPEFIYVRAYDGTVEPGKKYEYRLRVKVKNPNFGKTTAEVSRQSDTETEELPALDEHWLPISGLVSVPQAGYHYVVDPVAPRVAKKDDKDKDPLPAVTTREVKEGQAVVQVHRWIDRIGGEKGEPVGDWVTAELVANRGMFVTGRTLTPLPFWSSVEKTFVLRPLPGERIAKGREPRKGALITPIPPRTVFAVDIQGGRTSARLTTNPGERQTPRNRVDDEAGTEVLFLYADGSMDVRSSAADKADRARKDREDRYRKWVKQYDEASSQDAPKGKTGGGGDF